MIYLEYTPAPPLSSYVDTLWYCAGYTVAHGRERVVPNGCLGIILDLHNPRSLVVGVQPQAIEIETAELTEIMGVQFHPGGAPPLLHAPSHLFTGEEIALRDVWAGRSAGTLTECLQGAPTPDAKFRVLEAELLRRFKAYNPHPCVTLALAAVHRDPQTHVAQVLEQTGVSAKRLLSLFRHEVGIAPKLYCRIRRFRRTIAQAARRQHVAWAELSAECGYHDQSHMIRDFHEFAGITPSVYLDRPGTWAGHVPVL